MSKRAAFDTLRLLFGVESKDLESAGWKHLRFTAHQIQEEMAQYCIPKIVETINNLGGVEAEGKFAPHRIDLNSPDATYQPGLFDDLQES